MEKEDKKLLLLDLSGRLTYGVKVSLQYGGKQLTGVLDAVYPTEERVIVDELSEAIAPIDVRCGGFKLDESNIMPYLRPMSSMTEEEAKEYNELCGCNAPYPGIVEEAVAKFMDWLNAHHFDYRGLIEKGLALEAPEGMYD